jgi:hypothetical protein
MRRIAVSLLVLCAVVLGSLSAIAQMGMTGVGEGGFGHSGGGAKSYTFQTALNTGNDSCSGTITYTSVPIGTYSPTRVVIFAAQIDSNSFPVTSVSLGSGTVSVAELASDNGSTLFYATGVSGSTATFTFTFPNHCVFGNLAVWSADGLASNAPETQCTALTSCTLSGLTAGDFVFAEAATCCSSAPTFSGTSPAPAQTSHTIDGNSNGLSNGDWIVSGTSLTPNVTSGSTTVAAAVWH